MDFIKLKKLISILESDLLVSNKYNFVNSNDYKNIIFVDLPLFNKKNFRYADILDYYDASLQLKNSEISTYLINGITRILFRDESIIKGTYYLVANDNIQPLNVGTHIHEQISAINNMYLDDVNDIIVPLLDAYHNIIRDERNELDRLIFMYMIKNHSIDDSTDDSEYDDVLELKSLPLASKILNNRNHQFYVSK